MHGRQLVGVVIAHCSIHCQPRASNQPGEEPRQSCVLLFCLKDDQCRSQLLASMVKKLRGPVKKETKQERRDRRKDNRAAREKLCSVVIPVLVALFLCILVLFYWATRR